MIEINEDKVKIKFIEEVNETHKQEELGEHKEELNLLYNHCLKWYTMGFNEAVSICKVLQD